MKYIYYLGLTAFAFWLHSCSSEEVVNGEAVPKGNVTLTASYEGGGARTVFGEGYSLLWQKGDDISVYTSNNKFEQFLLAGEDAGKATGTFTGSIDQNAAVADIAVFPHRSTTSRNTNTLTMTLPSEIDFGDNGMSCGPMLARIEKGQLQFKHMCGLLHVIISNIPATADRFVITSSTQDIAGTFTADISPNAVPVLTLSANGSKTVTVKFTAGTSKREFYIPLPVSESPNTLDINLKVSATGGGTTFVKQLETSTVQRAGVWDLKELTIKEITGGTGKAVSDALKAAITTDSSTGGGSGEEEDDKIVLEEGNSAGVLLTETVSTANASTEEERTIAVPKVENTTVAVTFKATPVTTEDKPIVFAEAPVESSGGGDEPGGTPGGGSGGDPEISAAAEESTSKMELVLPPVTAEVAAPYVEVAAPRTTVSLSATTGKETTLKKVVAKTAINTLIVNKGVTVEELIIAGGNVEIYGTVRQLSRSDDNADAFTVVTVKEGGACTTVTDGQQKIKVADASRPDKWDGSTQTQKTNLLVQSDTYLIFSGADLAALQSEMQNCATVDLAATIDKNVRLMNDIDLDNKDWKGMVLGKTFTFDGNRHTISNVKVTSGILTENATNAPACAGLFGAMLAESTIKDLTVNKVVITADVKYMGGLVGLNSEATCANCKVKNVTITGTSQKSKRAGGLIGIISANTNRTIRNCTVEGVSVTGAYGLGGLVGSILCTQGTPVITIDECKATSVTAPVQTAGFWEWAGSNTLTDWIGYVSKFVGQSDQSSVVFKNCTAEDEFDASAMGTYKFGELKNALGQTFTGGCRYIGRVIGTNNTITVDGKTLRNGNGYNVYQGQAQTDGNPTEDYNQGSGNWNN